MYLTDITLVHLGNNDFLNPGDRTNAELKASEDSIVNFTKVESKLVFKNSVFPIVFFYLRGHKFL